MAVVHTQVLVGATATYTIVSAGTNYLSSTYYICNAGSASLFVGGTPAGATGFPVNPNGGTITMMLEPGETLYGWITAGTSGGTADVRVLGITGSR